MKYRNPFSGEKHSEFTWCLHCERVSKTKDWAENRWDCPYEDCDGGILDAHDWQVDDWPREVNKNYPEIPVVGEYYPLYRR